MHALHQTCSPRHVLDQSEDFHPRFRRNTFHTRQQLDEILNKAAEIGIKYILTISGDGNERLPKLSAESIGMTINTVTSVELMQFIGMNRRRASSSETPSRPLATSLRLKRNWTTSKCGCTVTFLKISIAEIKRDLQ